MSNQTNDLLIIWANELMEYFTGTYVERVLQRDIDANDLESLRYHVSEYAAQKAIEDDNGLVPMPDTSEPMPNLLRWAHRGKEEMTDVF